MRTSSKLSIAFCLLALTGAFAFAQQKANSNRGSEPAAAPMPLLQGAEVLRRRQEEDGGDRAAAGDQGRHPGCLGRQAPRRTSTTSTTQFVRSLLRHVGPGVRDLPRPLRPTLQQPDAAALSSTISGSAGAQGLARTSTPSSCCWTRSRRLRPSPRAPSWSARGMVSMLDNEAQLAYVLGHEIAHVEKNHAYQIVRMSVLEPALNAEKDKETKEKRAIATARSPRSPPAASAASMAASTAPSPAASPGWPADCRQQSHLPRPRHRHRMGRHLRERGG